MFGIFFCVLLVLATVHLSFNSLGCFIRQEGCYVFDASSVVNFLSLSYERLVCCLPYNLFPVAFF